MPKLLLLDGTRSPTAPSSRSRPTSPPRRAGHQRGVRLHVDADQGARATSSPTTSRSRSTRPGRTFRHELDADVQGRPQGDARHLRASRSPLIHEVLEALQIPHAARSPGVEADDVIATLATQAARPTASTSSSSPATATRYQLVARPAHQGALQPARRLRLRALRRGRHRRAHRRHARAVPRVRGAARRPERQPARRPGHRREDRGQAHHHLRRPRGHLRAPRRAAAEAAPEPRRGAATACSRTARCRCLRRDVDARRRARRPRAWARSTASRCASCSTSSSSARCCRACSRRSATSARPTPEADTLEVEVDVAPRRRGRSPRARWRAVADGDEPYAIEAALGRARRSQPRCVAARDRHRRRDATYVDGDAARRRRRCATALVALLDAGRPAARRAPRQGADARPRRSTLRSLEHDTAVMAYLLDPGEGKYLLEDLALRYLSLELHVARRRVEGTLDLDGDAERRARPAAAPRSSLRLADALARGARGARARPTSTSASSCPLVRVLARMETAGVRIDRRVPRGPARTELGERVRRARAARSTRTRASSSTSTRRRSCGAILFEKLGLIAGEEDQDRAVDRRRLAAEAGRGAPDRRGRCCATARSRSCAAPTPTRCRRSIARRRPHPRHVQPDRHHHRPHLERGAEPAEHPGAHRRRPRVPPGVHRRRRAAGCSPPTTRRSSCACSRTSPRTPG